MLVFKFICVPLNRIKEQGLQKGHRLRNISEGYTMGVIDEISDTKKLGVSRRPISLLTLII